METSPLLEDSTSRTKSPPSTDNQVNLDSAVAVVQDQTESSTLLSMTISKGEDEKSITISTPTNDQQVKTDNDSSIKLKRCKHGRIIIKDLSKKKLAQHSDNVTSKHGNESNNNQIIDESTHNDILRSKDELNQQSNVSMGSSLLGNLNEKPSEPPEAKDLDAEVSHNLSESKSHTNSQQPLQLDKSNERNASAESGNQISPSATNNERSTSRRLTMRARACSRSSSASLSPQVRSDRSPRRRSHYSRSPPRKDRSSSRDKIDRRNSRRHYDSPMPRRRARRSSSRRRRRRDDRRRSSSGRRNRTPERSRRSYTHRSRQDSPSVYSPHRKLPRSRSTTPSRSRDRWRGHRDGSHSPSRGPSKYDRHSHVNHDRSRERFEKPSHLHSPDNRRLRTDAIDSAADSYISTSLSSQPTAKQTVAQSCTKSSLAQVITTHQPSPQLLPEKKQVVKASPDGTPVAHSPTTSSLNDDSSSSDIYDPEGPIIPISPCDSPPISPLSAETGKPQVRPTKNEKSGEDDVPSSAVQLNQQEKYLQKLNRQERVIEEVKVALRPFYQNRSISKEQYKDVLRRAVPKICHSKNGEINPIKIRALVEAYVKKMKHH